MTDVESCALDSRIYKHLIVQTNKLWLVLNAT